MNRLMELAKQIVRENKGIFGILGVLVVVCLITASQSEGSFQSSYNIENVIRRTALFGILGIGVAFVIVTGGIDLSVGSVVCLVGCGLPWLLREHGWSIPGALIVVMLVSLGLGFFHGVMVAKVKLQPFVVTLCGLLFYRGFTRGFTQDQTQGFGLEFKGLRTLATGQVPLFGDFGIPAPCIILVVVGVIAAVFLNYTIYGRYLLALGNNEAAAKYSGINTDRMIILAYVICGGCSGLGGMLFVLDVNSAQPADFGNFYELFAIAAAVLGGCSLRGGRGSILGVVIGTALVQVLRNMITLVEEIPTNIEYAVIGAVILAGVTVDEVVKRIAARRRAAAEARRAAEA